MHPATPTPHPPLPNSLFRWCAPPHTPVRASQRSGPRWSHTGMPCWPAVNCRAGGGPSRRFGCGAWSRRTSSSISRITPVSETLYRTSRRALPREPYPQAWLLTCFSKPSHHLSNQWDCTFREEWMPHGWLGPLSARTKWEYVTLSLWFAQKEAVLLLLKFKTVKIEVIPPKKCQFLHELIQIRRELRVLTVVTSRLQLQDIHIWDRGRQNETFQLCLTVLWDLKC